jgi:hypothetical protein
VRTDHYKGVEERDGKKEKELTVAIMTCSDRRTGQVCARDRVFVCRHGMEVSAISFPPLSLLFTSDLHGH